MDIEVLKRAYEREKERRKKAENLLEEKSRELFLSFEKLDTSHSQLEQNHIDLQRQKNELEQLIAAYASVTDDLQLAAKLQIDLLPDALITDRANATGYFQPARFVGGDAYDYFLLSDDVLAFYLIDVEGHGTASAMTSFAVHSQLNPKYDGICWRNLENHGNHADTVIATVSQLNDSFFNAQSTNKYFTMIYGLLDLTSGKVTWCQAGHPALVLCTGKNASEIGDGGFPVGTLKEAQFTATSATMQAGDRIAIYSDGIIESFSKTKEAFGVSRLLDQLDQSRSYTQSDCIVSFTDTLQAWNNADEYSDDITLVLIDYLGKKP